MAQHAQVIVEHFRTHTAGRLGGWAKAMVVTASRHSAVQTARALKSYVADRDYPDPGILVAFSGALAYEGEETSESKENGGLPEAALPKAFAYTRADDPATRHGGAGQAEYRILVVAEKYQTGFDQPLLTTMYVNKTLTGIAAVQTLSRLNRTAERKSQADLAVLDRLAPSSDGASFAFSRYVDLARGLSKLAPPLVRMSLMHRAIRLRSRHGPRRKEPRVRQQTRVSEEALIAADARYVAGETLRSIAKQTGVSRQRLASLLRARGVRLRRAAPSPAEVAEMTRRYAEGESLERAGT